MERFKLLLLLGVLCSGQQATGAPVEVSRYARGSGHLDFGVRFLPSGTSYHEFADFTFSFGEGAIRTEIGWFGMVGRLHETYGALTYGRNQSKVSVGFPRPVYDGFAQTRLIDKQPREGLDHIWMSGSRATYGAMTIDGYLPYGARYDGQIRGVDVAASVHGVTGSDEIIIGIGAGLSLGDWALASGIEVTELGGDFSTNAKVRAERQFTGYSLGGAYYHPEANDGADHLEGYASFHPTQHLGIEAVAILPLSGADQPTYGASVQYDVGYGLALRASAIHPEATRDTLGLALRWAF